ncbi:GNAT family N-acetyltransferase [Ornithinimicrobium faecis]|uniref:GNAT family N-acetyltransferase n=1 Tax=Ornithinimicrobium faecis TaxID=2934158 RepID=A0ABY4YY55_9MICO|nr:GNAT family protein [Ornithinimicrobium sp. HY1793]USQ81185.1 GNAT family N-acetyltransferase [Ornithinimicrobium sp. HY1793]
MATQDRTFSDKPTLTGDLVTLRPVEPEDVQVMVGILTDPDLLRFTGSVHSTAEIEAAEEPEIGPLREWYTTRNDQPDRLDLMVVDNASGQVVGEVVLNEWDEGDRTCNYRTLFGPGGRDRGLGSEATRLLIDYAFTHLPLHRIDLEVYAFNPRAQRVYEKAGFVVEGTRREAFEFDGERFDAIIMGQLRSDWEAARS